MLQQAIGSSVTRFSLCSVDLKPTQKSSLFVLNSLSEVTISAPKCSSLVHGGGFGF